MGCLYKAYQKACFKSLEWSREKGIEVDKRRIEMEREKKDKEIREAFGYDWAKLNKHWDNLLQECQECRDDNFYGKPARHFD